MHPQDLVAPLKARPIHRNLAVEAARTQESRIQHIRAVGGGNHDNAGVALKAVHLGEQLVQGLLAFVVAPANAGPPLPAHRVDLVDEDDAGRILLGLLEEIPHARGAHPDKHFHKLRAGQAKERHSCLAGNGLGQKGFARPRRPHQQHAFGDLGPNSGEALRLLQEGNHLLQFFFGFFNPGQKRS
jgi:hypothetical protein